jgi:V/A-type H+-transporting ATPase subunit D
MAKTLKVNPTRGNLLWLKKKLDQARIRHALLDRKREALVRELMSGLERTRDLQERALRTARMRMGTDRVDWISLAPIADLDIRRGVRTFMELRLPAAELSPRRILPPYGPAVAGCSLHEAGERWLEAVKFLAHASDALAGFWRIGAEVRKTRRQVHALEKMHMPRRESAIADIEAHLEEKEREEIVKAKKLKERESKSRIP